MFEIGNYGSDKWHDFLWSSDVRHVANNMSRYILEVVIKQLSKEADIDTDPSCGV